MRVAARFVLLTVVGLLCLSLQIQADNGWKPRNFCRCPHTRDYVCAFDGNTYDSVCEAKCFGKNVKCKGRCPCPKPSPLKTPSPSPRETPSPSPPRSPRPPSCIPTGHPCRSSSKCCPCKDTGVKKCWAGKCFCPVKNDKPKKGKKSKGGKKDKGGKNGKGGKRGKNGKGGKGGKKDNGGKRGKNGKGGKGGKKGKGGKGKGKGRY